MKKPISFTGKGRRADIGHLTIYRMLPNRYARAVGPFVFLDHIAPMEQAMRSRAGTGAHPHRGIATLSYILQGEDEHFDSAGNYAKVHSGGVQWMKAGNGVVHDETLNADSNTDSRVTHGFQFWINLPAVNKAEAPAYLAIEGSDVPVKNLAADGSWIKVIAGNYEELRSPVPDYSGQFLYHLHLLPGKSHTVPVPEGWESAAFLPGHPAVIDDTVIEGGEFVGFGREGSDITLQNHTDKPADIILFGGAPYTEPIVAEGPFVMNHMAEIGQAYLDFHNGKYGTIQYKQEDPANAVH